jgi:GTP-binding protein
MYNGRFRHVHLPGYGYSRASKEQAIQYLSLFDYYLTERRNQKRAFVLVDSKVGLKEIETSVFV